MRKSYFNFNRNEKLGVLALSGLILILTVVLNVGSSVYVPDPFDVDQSQLEFLSLNTNAEQNQSSSGDFELQSFEEAESTPVYKDFDPNKISLKDWMELGFSEKQAQSIVNYRNNYGPFKRKEDIQKLYVVSAEKYLEIEPYIKIERSEKNKDYNKTESVGFVDTTMVVIELNSATREDLMALGGIGPTFADRILSYRTKIGGFVDPEQIEELYVSDDAKVVLKQHTEIDADRVTKTNINTASKNELRQIPYSNWSVVAAILKERDRNKIEDLSFLTEKEITPEEKVKFQLYVDF